MPEPPRHDSSTARGAIGDRSSRAAGTCTFGVSGHTGAGATGWWRSPRLRLPPPTTDTTRSLHRRPPAPAAIAKLHPRPHVLGAHDLRYRTTRGGGPLTDGDALVLPPTRQSAAARVTIRARSLVLFEPGDRTSRAERRRPTQAAASPCKRSRVASSGVCAARKSPTPLGGSGRSHPGPLLTSALVRMPSASGPVHRPVATYTHAPAHQ